ncbi:kinetochore component rough deal [Amblyomma americanum]
MIWTNVCCNFGGETSIFGQRKEEQAGSQPYEVHTRFTIGADTDSVPVKPAVKGVVSEKHFAVAIDDAVSVFSYDSLLFSTSFGAFVDAIAFCSGLLGGLLIVAERSANLHIYSLEPVQCVVKLPVPKTESNSDGALVRSVDVKRNGDNYIVCVLTAHHVITATVSDAAIALLAADTDQPDLSPLQIRVVDIRQLLASQELALSLTPMASVCLLDDTLLVTGGCGALCCIPMSSGCPAYNLLNDVAGERASKMFLVDSLCTLLVLTEANQLVSICLKTFLIKDIWRETTVEDFVFAEGAAAESDLGPHEDCRIAVLTAVCETSARRLEIYSFPALVMLYALEVNETCHLMTFSDCLEDFWVVEGFSDSSDTVNELRVRSVTEAVPENQLMKLINKNKFEEAENFARLFDLPVEEVHWHHLLYVLNKLGTRLQDVPTDEEAELNLVCKACKLIEMLPDVLQAARCCIETHIASPSVASELLLFLQGHISSAQCPDSEERALISEQISSLLNRATTFRFLCGSNSKSDWFSFSQADLIEEMCGFFKNDDMSAGFFLWERHQDELSPGLNCDIVQNLLDSIPMSAELPALLQWLSGSFLPCIFKSFPEGLECICQWIVDRVRQMEVSNKSVWPSGALKLAKIVLDHFEQMSTKADCLPLNTWLAVHSAPQRIRDEKSALCKLYHLCSDLKDLEVLWGKYHCRLTVQELQDADKQEVAFTILDEAITKEQVTSLVQGFLIEYVKSQGLDISRVLQAYVDRILIHEGASLIRNELLEDSMVTLTAFIDHPECWLYAVKKILSYAHVPWSEGIERLADQGSLLRGSAAEEIEQERRRMHVKVILMRYDVSPFHSMLLNKTSALVKCILLSEKQEALQDALTVVRNLGEMSESDVFLLFLQRACMKADIDMLSGALQSVPHKIFVELAPRLLVFAELLPQHPKLYSDISSGGLMECWQYLLSVLHQTLSDGAIDYDKLHCWARQGIVLRRDFGITVSAPELCCESSRYEILKQGFLNLVLNESMHDHEALRKICRRALCLAGVLKLDKQSAIEVMLTSALELKRDDIVDSLCGCLLELHCIRESVLTLLPELFFKTEDVLCLVDKIQQIASRVGLASKANYVKSSVNICLWARILIQASVLFSGTSHRLAVPKCVCPAWEQGVFREGQVCSLDRKQMLACLRALGRSVWGLLADKRPAHLEEVKLNLQATCHCLCQSSLSELCLSVVVAVLQLFCDSELQDSVHKALCEIAEDQVTKNVITSITRSTNQKHVDLPFVRGLLCSLQSKNALATLRRLIASCNGNVRLLKTVATVGLEVFSGAAQKTHFRLLLKGVYWCQKLTKLNISFTHAMTNPDPANIQNVLEQMEKSLLVNVNDLLNYCTSFSLDIKSSLSRRLEFLLCTQAESCAQDWSLSQTLAEASHVLKHVPSASVQKVLTKILAKVNPYRYEVLQFGYEYIKAIKGELESSIEKEMDILHFLDSYRRYSPPTEQEMDLWCEEYPQAELSSLMKTRLPFRLLLHKSVWNFINDELYPETVDAWLNIADILGLDKDDIRFMAVHNAVRMWSAQKHKGNILDLAFLSSVKRLVQQMSQKEKAVACLAGLIQRLPKGPTATRVAKECASLPASIFVSGEGKSKPSDMKARFIKKYIKLRNEQLLKQHSLDLGSNLALCGNSSDLVASLLENARWHVVVSDTSAIYSCVNQIVDSNGLAPVDFPDILDKSVKRWLGFHSPEQTCDESALELNFMMIPAGNLKKCTGFVTIVQLMQHIPEQMNEVLSRIVSASDSFIGPGVRALALMCMLAGHGTTDPTSLEVAAKCGVANLDDLRALTYKAKLQSLGILLHPLSVDAESASEVARAVLCSSSRATAALAVASDLCIEYGVQAASTWEALLLAATSAGAADVICRTLPFLGCYPLLWSKPAFISAWQYILQNAHSSLFGALKGALPLLLRCPCVRSLPPMFHEDEDCCTEEGVLLYFVYMLLRHRGNVRSSVKKLLQVFSLKSRKLPDACKAQLNVLKLASIAQALDERP